MFGFNSSLANLASDVKGFVNAVAEELQTVIDPEHEQHNDADPQFQQDAELEEELKQQLLELSEDEAVDDANDIDHIDTAAKENDDIDSPDSKENDDGDVANAEETPPSDERDVDLNATHQSESDTDANSKGVQVHRDALELASKYAKLKRSYRQSMTRNVDLKDKYQVLTVSLKQRLNELTAIDEQRTDELSAQHTMNVELNTKVIGLQKELSDLKSEQTQTRSIFEDAEKDEMVLKAVSLSQSHDANVVDVDEMGDLREELSRLRREYAAHRIESSNELKRARRSVRELTSMQRKAAKEAGLSKELSSILLLCHADTKSIASLGAMDSARIGAFQTEMRRVLEGTAATVRWMRATAKLDVQEPEPETDYKSDSLVVIGDDSENGKTKKVKEKERELSMEELMGMKGDAVTLRAAVCEVIAENQQWLKAVCEAVQRREQFEDID